MAINRTDTDNGLDAMFPATDEPTQAAVVPQQDERQPRTQPQPQPTTTQDGRKQITFKLPADVIDKIRAFSYWERVEQWQFVADAIQAAVDKYERKNGALQPPPKR